jgi:acetate kinase
VSREPKADGDDMPDALLVLNAGSSSLKFSVFLAGDPPQPVLRGQLEGLLTQPRFRARDATAVVGEKEWPAGTRLGHQGAIEFLFAWGRDGVFGGHRIVAVGHRVVHGGVRFSAPALVDAATVTELEALVPLAPLHQPHNVAAIKAVAEMAPQVRQVACFDTAFHRTQPPVAQAFALPRRFADEGVRRYGFHGLSYEYVASMLPKIDGRAAQGRTVVAHLGNGTSMCAMQGGRSVATTMSFTIGRGAGLGGKGVHPRLGTIRGHGRPQHRHGNVRRVGAAGRTAEEVRLHPRADCRGGQAADRVSEVNHASCDGFRSCRIRAEGDAESLADRGRSRDPRCRHARHGSC